MFSFVVSALATRVGAMIMAGLIVILGMTLIVTTVQKNHYKAKAEDALVKLDRKEAQIVAAKQEAAERDKANEKRIKDAKNAVTAANALLAKWVRESGTKPRGLPEESATAKRADGTICYDYAELDGALQRYRQGISGLLAEGQQAVIDRQELVGGWPH